MDAVGCEEPAHAPEADPGGIVNRCESPELVLLSFALLTACPRPAAAWGFEVHKYIMARAIPLLPPEIRPYFEKYQTSIVEHSIDPDLWRTAGWTEEPPRHFVDMDAYGPYPFTGMPHVYDEAVKRYGVEFVHEERNAAVARARRSTPSSSRRSRRKRRTPGKTSSSSRPSSRTTAPTRTSRSTRR